MWYCLYQQLFLELLLFEGNSNNANIKVGKPMTLKHSLDGALGKPMICNEGTDINNMNND